jgi:transcriptional regulator with XRE-family HTH domain
MSPREAFGPNLRRIRIQRGISLHQIAAETKVSVDLWDGLEQNNFDRWPGGIFARAYVREYARLIGADPESTVDDFCRWFPQGDRRVLRVVREQAEIVGHQLQWREQLPPAAGEIDRREESMPAVASKSQTQPSLVNLFLRLRRTLGKA